MKHSIHLVVALSCALVVLVVQCSSPASAPGAVTAHSKSAEAWNTIYQVLQHPRCVNCHPVGDAPLVGDARQPHPQNVQRGPDGNGLFGMRRATCHQSQNLAGAHMPPGTPNWRMPHPAQPLVFEGRSSGDLCRQLRDPARNGKMTPEQLNRHMTEDPLVLWGWIPGEGRAPVSIPHTDVVRAMHDWIDGGCDCPK